MRWIRMAGGAAAIAAAMLTANDVLAGKPGGGGGTTPPGTIYFKVDGASIWSMDGDGGAKTFLTTGQSQGATDRASRLLHGGKRWFLRSEVVPGEVGQGGGNRMDLFAVREDGAMSVRLTDDPLMDYRHGRSLDWCPDESADGVTIAGVARRWTGTTSADTVVAGSAGLYVAHLSFDASGNVVGLDAEPSFLVSLGTVDWYGGELADALTVTWSPDMSLVACDRAQVPVASRQVDIRVVDVATGAATVIMTAPHVGGPNWAPDGSSIAYSVGGAIETVTPDGAVRRTLATATESYGGMGSPRFSPDSAWVAFGWQHRAQGALSWDVGRVSASGGTVANLTSRIGGNAGTGPIDWR